MSKSTLIIGTTLASTYLVKCIAAANRDSLFTYMTMPENHVDLPNVSMVQIHLNYIHNTATGADEFHLPIGWIAEQIEKRREEFDLVLVMNYEFQRSPYFHEVLRRAKVPLLCPDLSCSRLEHEKLFAKSILKDCGIPTPDHRQIDRDEAMPVLDAMTLPIVFKLNKHTGFLGYGSWVFTDRSYREVLPKLISYQPQDQAYYTEAHVKGREVSAHFLCNGSRWIYLGSARDYKRINEGDRGHNTSGVGCYSPVDYFSEGCKKILFSYMDRLMQYLTDVGIHYSGFLYVGVMIDDEDRPHVLELNTRPGSPEFLTILAGLDHVRLLENLRCAANRLPFTGSEEADVTPAVAICLRHQSYGPRRKWYSTLPILVSKDGIDLVRSSQVLGGFNFYGAMVATGPSIEAAADSIYDLLGRSMMGDYTYRKDIGKLK